MYHRDYSPSPYYTSSVVGIYSDYDVYAPNTNQDNTIRDGMLERRLKEVRRNKLKLLV